MCVCVVAGRGGARTGGGGRGRGGGGGHTVLGDNPQLPARKSELSEVKTDR